MLQKQLRPLASKCPRQRLDDNWRTRAKALLDSLWLDEMSINEAEPYPHLLDLCRILGYKDLGVKLLNNMYSQGMDVPTDCVHIMMELCVDTRDWDRVLAFFEVAGSSDQVAINYGLRAIAATKGVEAALAKLERMQARGEFLADVATYTSILEEGKNVEEAWGIVERRMSDSKLKVTSDVYGALLGVCRRVQVEPKEKLSESKAVWRQLEDSGRPGTERCYTEIIKILRENNKFRDVAHYFDEALEKNVKLRSPEVWALAIEANSERRNFKRSMLLFEEARKRGVSFTREMFLVALKCCRRSQAPDMSLFLLYLMAENGVEADIEMYKVVLLTLSKAEYYTKVVKIFEELHEKIDVSSLNARTIKCVIDAFLACGVESDIFHQLNALQIDELNKEARTD